MVLGTQTLKRPQMTRQEVSALLTLRLNSPSEMQRYAREAKQKENANVSTSHAQRRVRMTCALHKAEGNFTTLIRLWEDTVAPHVAVSYAGTLLAMRPDLKTPQVKAAIDRIRQNAPVIETKRAMPITAEMINEALRTAPPHIARTIVLMWISASRHVDLLRVHSKQAAQIARGVLLLQWGAFKSDRYGKRAYFKFCYVPPRFRHLFLDWTLATYWEVYRHLKSVSKSLSVHSLRRGGACLLADAGFSMAEIGMITGHTPTADPHMGVRRYVDPSEAQPESQKQLEMSRILARVVA